MNLKKMTAFVLTAVLIALALTGCTTPATSPFVSDNPSESPQATPTDTAPAAVLNLEGAYDAYSPETVMLTINNKDIPWSDFFYFINYSIAELQAQGITISNWSDIYTDETTYKDYILDTAAYYVLQTEAITYGAQQLNVTLSEQDQVDIQADWDAGVTSAGSEEAFLAQLQQQFCTKELFNYLMTAPRLVVSCFNALYGENGGDLSDTEVADYTAEDGYLMAKHILFMTVDMDETGASTAKSEEDSAQVLKTAEKVLSELKNYSGDDFEAFFDEEMNAYSEDSGGLSGFPDGYLFQNGDMYAEFEEGTKALKIGEISPELVESKSGYHIIYRLPINYDVTPIRYATSGEYSLRFLTAQSMFSSVADTWMNSLQVDYSKDYEALDFNKIFAAG